MAANYNEFKQIFELYDETSKRLEDIRGKLNTSVLPSKEMDEVSYHHAVFRNMKNFLVTQMNSMISATGYTGFKEEAMMLPFEIRNEQEVFQDWERLAFDEKNPYAKKTDIESFQGNPEEVFAGSEAWTLLAFSEPTREDRKLGGPLKDIERITQEQINNLTKKQWEELTGLPQEALTNVNCVIADILKDTEKNYNPELMEDEKTDKMVEYCKRGGLTHDFTSSMDAIMADTAKTTFVGQYESEDRICELKLMEKEEMEEQQRQKIENFEKKFHNVAKAKAKGYLERARATGSYWADLAFSSKEEIPSFTCEFNGEAPAYQDQIDEALDDFKETHDQIQEEMDKMEEKIEEFVHETQPA